MLNISITCFQIFAIGFSFGFAGPCFLLCTPILIPYLAGREAAWKRSLGDICSFLTGRFFAYLLLGYLAGISAGIVRRFSDPAIASIFKSFGGVIIIFLALLVLINKEPASSLCKYATHRNTTTTSLLLLGFIIGVVPCAPLVALLFEITLLAKIPAEGVFYAFWFGLGTFISGFITIASISGLLRWLPATLIKSQRSKIVFRIICALLLATLGIGLIAGR